ncbi:sigma-70 family RNA polymerase sigma factor [Leptospira barantonii]|uniref:Sigma-70 family RNA polymerase sigma factor n=1 Tax=Leptospira barantonii TaxID=2023184 RepID=A0A5F2BNT7_9LEPT|nr:sigma-70 family RNA polymerase sigma factor [Leptospira barantonii]TGM07223.1 sigma-70 family RNA polymerase sigma factor [Leptospira barantonii]
MQNNSEQDRIFINSYLEYKHSGNSEALIEQAAFWIRRIAVRKFSLSEDGKNDVLVRFIQKIEYFSEIYEKGKYENFPAFAIKFLKHLVLNQWKKEIQNRKREPGFLEPDSLIGPVFHSSEMETETAAHRIFLNDILKNFDPRGVLILKLKHNLFLERWEILLLKSILSVSGNSIRDFLKERMEKRYSSRKRELDLLERMEVSHQILFSERKNARDRSSRSKSKLKRKLLRLETIYTYEEISFWFSWKSSLIKKLYLQTMNSLKDAGKNTKFIPISEEEEKEAA